MGTLKLGRYVKGDDPQILVRKQVQQSITNHDHDFYELVYIADGYCLHGMAGRMTLLMAGDMFIIPPGKVHRYMCNQDIKLYNCMFSSEAFGELYSKLSHIPEVNSLLNPSFDGFMHAHSQLVPRSYRLRRGKGRRNMERHNTV